MKPENPFSKPTPARKRPAARPVESPAIANPEPPIAVAPPALPPEPPPEKGESGERKLGRAIEAFSPSEITYIDDQMRQYMDILKNNPSVQTFVNEAIIANIEMQRHDKLVELQRKKYQQDGDAGDRTEWFLRMEKIRTSLLRRYTDSLEALGALPKDKVGEAEADECMSDVHLRYLAEIKARKAVGQKIGEPSAEAMQLARDHGLDPARYRSDDVLSDADRTAIIEAASDGQ